jgi:hypothetical protein
VANALVSFLGAVDRNALDKLVGLAQQPPVCRCGALLALCWLGTACVTHAPGTADRVCHPPADAGGLDGFTPSLSMRGGMGGWVAAQTLRPWLRRLC